MFARCLALTWFCIMVPMTAAGLSGGPDGLVPHVLFHFAYIPIMLLTLWPILRLRGAARGSVRVLVTIVAVVYPLAAVGQVGEVIVAILHGGMHPTAEVFDDPTHMTFAAIGGLALFGTLFLMAAASIVAGIRLVRGADRIGWLVLLPGVIFPLEMIIAIAGFMPSRSLVGTTLSALVLTAGSMLTPAKDPRTSALVSRDATPL